MLEWHFCWQVSLHSNSKWATIDKYVPVKLKPITKLIVKVMVHVDLLIDYCFMLSEQLVFGCIYDQHTNSKSCG
jgi:hypothetical protein